MKILIAVPYHERKRYCLDKLYDSIDKLMKFTQNAGHDVQVFVRHDPFPFGRPNNVKIQREALRDIAIASEADYLFFHGADTIPPVDAIVKMIDSGHEVVSGVYWQRGEQKAMNAIAWFSKEYDPLAKNAEMLDTFQEDPIIQADGFGLDCVLIHKNIFKEISWLDWEVNDDDYPFCDRAIGLTELMIDRSIQCQHWDTEKSYSYNGKYFVV